ncbi:MAG TPA: hypothetical protein VE591_09785 [Candidatus Acidoferrum sp.]|nr:hypothetical protein [Candidatus Acidoferrum sp.]
MSAVRGLVAGAVLAMACATPAFAATENVSATPPGTLVYESYWSPKAQQEVPAHPTTWEYGMMTRQYGWITTPPHSGGNTTTSGS